MRVVLVLGPSTGGIGTHVRDLAEHCVAHGDRVVVVGPPSTEQHFSFTATGARFAPLTDLRRALRAADVVHSHGLRPAVLTNLARWGRRRAPRHVVTLHNAILARGLRARISELIERLAVRPPDVVLGASADLVHRASELGARHAVRCPVPAPPLPPPVEKPAEVRAALQVPDSDLLILTVARLAPQKSLPVLLDAVAALSDLPIRLVIAGDGPDRAALAARIEAGKLPVILLGHRPDIPDLLAAADVFALPSRWEARPLVLQEAMRAGTPVVATAVGGIPDLVADAALLTPPEDASALAAALRRVLTDRALRTRLSAAGPALAATWPTPAESLAAVRGWYAPEG